MDSIRDLHGVLCGNAVEKQCEFISAHACNGVARSTAREQSLRHGGDQPISGSVAEAVVDHLEIVEVKEQQAHGARLTLGQRVSNAVQQQRAVRQVGKRSVRRLIRELILEASAISYIAIVDDKAID